MRVADYIVKLITEAGIEQTFMVTGGGAMHLNDAIGRENKLKTVFCHHEQACAIAAESYARLSGTPALVSVTSGPGGINALNGIFGAFVDSIPMIVVSGQVKRETLVTTYDLPLRQLGDQEVNIVAMSSPITKLSVQLTDPNDTKYLVEKCLWLAVNGRPGPVWIDVPIDIQSTKIDLNSQRSFKPALEGQDALPVGERYPLSGEELKVQLTNALKQMATAQRPVVLVGTGIRSSKTEELLSDFLEKVRVPVVTGFNAHDVLPDKNPFYVGRPGTVGDRAGNFAVQSSDFLLVLGCRLNIRQIGYNFEDFARNAYITMIDVDNAELEKPTLSIDQPIHSNLIDAMKALSEIQYEPKPEHEKYLSWCLDKKKNYPAVLSGYFENSEVLNPYAFSSVLSDCLGADDVVITGDGTACVVTFQTTKIKENQRMFSNSGCASMGYDLPAAIGAAVAAPDKNIVCLAGDGSIMMNIQELQTIVTNNLNIKIIVFNNNGYSSIRQTQQNYFPDNIVGCGPESGVSFPEFARLAEAFNIPSRAHHGLNGLKDVLSDFLSKRAFQFLEVFLDQEQPFAPKLSSRQLPDGSMISGSLDDLAPFLSDEERISNRID